MSQNKSTSELRAAAAEHRIRKNMTSRERSIFDAEQARRQRRSQADAFVPILDPTPAQSHVFDTGYLSFSDIELAKALAESFMTAESEKLQRRTEAFVKAKQEEADFAYAQELADFAYAQELASASRGSSHL